MIAASDVEAALRSKLQATDVEVIDISGGCETFPTDPGSFLYSIKFNLLTTATALPPSSSVQLW